MNRQKSSIEQFAALERKRICWLTEDEIALH